MNFSNKTKALKMAVSLAVSATISTSTLAGEGDKQLEGYEKLTKSFLEPHGNWMQMNDEYVEGVEAPKYWLTTFSEGPGGQSVISDVYMVAGTDSCTKIAHFIYYFDEDEGVFQRAAMLGNGMFKTGPITYTEEGEYVSIVKINTPDGELTMKDTGKMVDQDTRSASAHFLNADTGEWDYGDTHYWRRAGADFQNPC